MDSKMHCPQQNAPMMRNDSENEKNGDNLARQARVLEKVENRNTKNEGKGQKNEEIIT